MPKFEIKVFVHQKLTKRIMQSDTLVVGRRDARKGDPVPIAKHKDMLCERLIVVDQDCVSVPRHWFELSVSRQGNSIAVKNIHASLAVLLEHGESIAAGTIREMAFGEDAVIRISEDIVLRVSIPSGYDSSEFRSLQSSPFIPGEDSFAVPARTIRQFALPEAKQVSTMLRVALQVVQKAAGSDAFFQAAAAATTEIVDLDRTLVLIRKDWVDKDQILTKSSPLDDWCSVAMHVNLQRTQPAQDEISKRIPSLTLLSRVMETGTTVIHDPNEFINTRDDQGRHLSLVGVECAVASPILNKNKEIIGVLYGDRKMGSSNADSHTGVIDDLEATLVEILAGSVAGGIARQEEERFRGALCGFFSPKVAELIATHPELMEGQDADVSVLFCDIRQFSTVTEQLGPKKAIEWINDVMSELSQCVIDRDGVLVDYVGDELLAMWGAPGEQPDHAKLAIDAARAMLQAIEVLRVRWADVLPERFGAGIGINTGPARVGNVGSRQKFKYGALGNTVNLGSRLQSATKQLGVRCIASGDTMRAAENFSSSRRLAKITVVGIEHPIDVHEIIDDANDAWERLAVNYQSALTDFEARRFADAARKLGEILSAYPGDPPSRKLLVRSVAELDEPNDGFTGIWRLDTK